MQKLPPKELEPRAHDRTGWRALTRHAMDTFEERRCTQIEEARERRKASSDAPGNPGLFPCPHCPWTCKSRIGLHSHLRAHGRREQCWRASLSIAMDYYCRSVESNIYLCDKLLALSHLSSLAVQRPPWERDIEGSNLAFPWLNHTSDFVNWYSSGYPVRCLALYSQL